MRSIVIGQGLCLIGSGAWLGSPTSVLVIRRPQRVVGASGSSNLIGGGDYAHAPAVEQTTAAAPFPPPLAGIALDRRRRLDRQQGGLTRRPSLATRARDANGC